MTYAYSPKGYTVEHRSIVVRRRLVGPKSISLEGIREVRTADPGELRGAIRLWGNGGLFGYYGLFRTPKLGKSRWYLTTRRNAVVVVTESQTALFSPDDVEGFLATVAEAAPAPQVPARPAPFDQAPARGGRWIGSAIAVVVALAVIAILALAVTYSPGPPAYTLTPRSLTIHDRFYPVTVDAAAVDVDRIRVVDITGDSEWRPVERTNGFANSHYRSGWFRAGNGLKVRLYRAQANRLVLLPPKGPGNAVLLEVGDPEGFVQTLRQDWPHETHF